LQRRIAREKSRVSLRFVLEGDNMERILKNILDYVQKHPMEYSACEDLLGMSREAMKADLKLGVKYLKELSARRLYRTVLQDEKTKF